MGVIINTEPIELVIDGTTILMQADPTASPAWDALMEAEASYKTPEARDQSKKALTDALTVLAHTPEDAETLAKLDLGVATLYRAALGYAEAVTGFPTQPPSTSTKRSKATSGT